MKRGLPAAIALLFVAALGLVITGCGGDEDETSTEVGASTDEDFQFSEAPPAEAEHWAEVWCEIDGSTTRDGAIELMGEPTEEFDAESGGQPQSQWDVGDFHYTLFYDTNGLADQAYVNPLEIEEAGIAKPFDCPLVRHF